MLVGDQAGNLGAACIPYGLGRAIEHGRLHDGDRVLVVAFGAGRTWGSTVLTWSGN
ncbi:3-oxoacyl-[acyl-carrier-protein] synthase III C-terminal domain-containing protein [Streptomyces sp. T12]|uniref:3-oxoacyl-[acyl-carrier-protein] synthase III C-terminal domain-containing protein n=1 Tax=unclassified Streptomyces TaxID=2593676 RepID=UPI0027D336B1|nr:3-oxoacyl-[acyl-carrier-protein] synthase III C-terminal domain-containing protein [Streptomyces sp. T12]